MPRRSQPSWETTANMPIVLLLGPTAAGKTDAAAALAERQPCHLISMDSALVYRGLDIGTAKPPPALLARHPHALIDIRDPAHSYTAADFVADADLEVRHALQQGKLPVLVGGTMLYARAFRDGLAVLPPADPEVRAAIEAEAAAKGWPKLRERLAQVDPAAAANIHPHNGARLQRALEVFMTTGKPISAYWREQGQSAAPRRLGQELLEFALVPDDRAALHRRIEARFDVMLAQGFVDEVRTLRARGDLHLGLPSMRAVGYRQVWRHLDGEWDAEQMRAKGIAATRQLARRQLTWLRGWPWLETLPAADLEAAAAHIRTKLG